MYRADAAQLLTMSTRALNPNRKVSGSHLLSASFLDSANADSKVNSDRISALGCKL